MKVLIFAVILFINVPGTFAQILNGGFENWNGTEPQGWKTSNSGSSIFVTKSTDSHAGSFALSSSVITFAGISYGGYLRSGENGEGFSIDQKYTNFTGYYKLIPAGANDKVYIIILLYRITTTDTTLLGSGAATLEESQNFSQFKVDLLYGGQSLDPNWIKISFSVVNTSSSQPFLGTQYILDDLVLTNTVDIRNEKNSGYVYSLSQNYPNPFNPKTSIKYSIKENTYVNLIIMDVVGRELKTLVDEEKLPGNYEVEFDGSKLSSGVYFYRIKAGNFIQTRKMLLLK